MHSLIRRFRALFFFVTSICVFSFYANAERPATFHYAQPEVYAIGDLHGDFNAMVSILRAARLIDSNNRWIGGTKTLVQVGDQLDRGDTEKEILDLFESLIDQAERAGGQVLVLNGNHETMNVALDFRYITREGFRQFNRFYTGQTDRDVRSLPSEQRGRAVAFKPGGPYARVLADHNSIVQIGETVYVHGGITLSHANYGLDRINTEISEWMLGYSRQPSSTGGSGPLWNRDYGGDVSSRDCRELAETLGNLNAKRLVIAHTRQRRINQACNGMVWRVDVGMASYYGGRLQALKITNDDLIQIVEENGRITDTGFGGDGGNNGGGNCSVPARPSTPVASNVVTNNAGSSSYTISWSAVSGAVEYQVQRWSQSRGAWRDVARTSRTRMTISGEQRDVAYSRVIGINSCGDVGSASDFVTVDFTSPEEASCPRGYTEYTGTISSDGTASLLSDGYYYASANVTHGMRNLGAALELQLYWWDGNAWDLQRSSSSSFTYSGTEGYYYPFLAGDAGQSYRVCLLQP